MKQCSNCKTVNPQHAKYCRMCGKELETSKHNICEQIINRLMHLCKVIMFDVKERLQPSNKEENAFTPDVFSAIQLSPKSICKIRFRIIPWLITFVFSCVIFYLLAGYSSILYKIWIELENELGYFIWHIREGLILIFALIIAISAYQWLKKSWKYIKYHINADYIEEYAFSGTMVRIAKNSRLGLFDNKSKKVRLRTIYSNITLFDDEHLLLERDDKLGLYSITLKRIIIPVKYTSIEHFYNSMTSASIGNTKDYYDIKGNRIK